MPNGNDDRARLDPPDGYSTWLDWRLSKREWTASWTWELAIADLADLRDERDRLAGEVEAARRTGQFWKDGLSAANKKIDQQAARIEVLETAIKAVIRDAAGRSGGSVYLVHREQFFALKAALAGGANKES